MLKPAMTYLDHVDKFPTICLQNKLYFSTSLQGFLFVHVISAQKSYYSVELHNCKLTKFSTYYPNSAFLLKNILPDLRVYLLTHYLFKVPILLAILYKIYLLNLSIFPTALFSSYNNQALLLSKWNIFLSLSLVRCN